MTYGYSKIASECKNSQEHTTFPTIIWKRWTTRALAYTRWTTLPDVRRGRMIVVGNIRRRLFRSRGSSVSSRLPPPSRAVKVHRETLRAFDCARGIFLGSPVTKRCHGKTKKYNSRVYLYLFYTTYYFTLLYLKSCGGVSISAFSRYASRLGVYENTILLSIDLLLMDFFLIFYLFDFLYVQGLCFIFFYRFKIHEIQINFQNSFVSMHIQIFILSL